MYAKPYGQGKERCIELSTELNSLELARFLGMSWSETLRLMKKKGFKDKVSYEEAQKLAREMESILARRRA